MWSLLTSNQAVSLLFYIDFAMRITNIIAFVFFYYIILWLVIGGSINSIYKCCKNIRSENPPFDIVDAKPNPEDGKDSLLI